MTEEEKRDKELKNLFAGNLKMLRKQADFSQEVLAEELNVNSRTIQRWENAERIPKHKYLQTMANLFNVSVEELLSANIGQRARGKAVGKSTISNEPVPAEKVRTKTKKAKFAENVIGLSEVLMRDFE